MGAFEFWSGPAKPFIALESTAFYFFALNDSSIPEDQVLLVRNGWAEELNWQITEDCNWLEVLPTGGTSVGDINEVILRVDPSGLLDGDYSCLLVVSDPNAANKPQNVSVKLRVAPRLVPGEYSTIQEAIDAVFAEGEIIIVADGTYTGDGNKNIDVIGKTITIMSENGPQSCIIDCENSGGGFYLCDQDSNSVLDGFTIINGSSIGISCARMTSTIINCIISNNNGSGINCDNSSPVIQNCIISGNSGFRGGGINCSSSSPTIINCLITGNNAGEYGGGIACKGDYHTHKIINCTISDNSAGRGGAIDLITAIATISNSIFWNNSPIEIGKTGTGTALVTYSNIQGGWTGEGNIDVEPLFAAPDDYHLVFGSPCIDAGTNDPPGGLPTTDLDGISRPFDGDLDSIAVADMGAYELLRNPNNPILAVSPATFEFRSSAISPNPDAQTLSIWNATVGTLNWQITEDCDWLEITPISGESSGEIDEVSVSVTPDGLSFGEYSSVLTVFDPYDSNNIRLSEVRLLVIPEIYVPDNFQTIQNAIDAAFEGCEVIVADGTYTGSGNRDIDFKGKAITVRSENGPENCIIDCQDAGRGFYFHSVENSDSILDGFTITNGCPTLSEGGGIMCLGTGTDPTIQNCIITENIARNGGGICCGSGSPTIKNCLVINNHAYTRGGGIYHWSSSLATITGCTISNNTASYEVGGVYSGYNSNPTITNCIVWDNGGGEIGGGMTTPNCKIGVDPNFVTGRLGDYYLSQIAAGQASDSSCVDAGSDTAVNLGMNKYTTRTDDFIDLGTVDIGYHYPVVFGSPDIDENWYIDFGDFAVLANDWQQQGHNLAGDIYKDNYVGLDDLDILADSWLDCYVTAASILSPADNAAGVDPNADLSWSVGNGAVYHDIYFGTDVNAVADASHSSAEFMAADANTTFDPGPLDIDSTYYWRIDEVGPKCTAKGDVWTFTTWPELDPNLISWWKFDEGQGNIAYDSTGTNDGTIYGAQWTSGQIGNWAIDFDGVNDYIDTTSADLNLAGTDTITVSAWIFAEGQGAEGIIIGDYNKNNTHGWIVDFCADRRFRATNIDFTKSRKRRSSPLELNTWHHVVAVIYPDNRYPEIYVDGLPDNNPFTSGSTPTQLYRGSGNVIIGRQSTPAERYFNGAIDDVRIYDRALSLGEVQQLYQAGQ
ncbi:MAG: LamG-like jellyroll fold domain-containing protein [Planctomycetota bacterium]|jgi:parallel beta-helix repeat protein